MSLFSFNKKPVIVTIHGFGQKLHHEFDPLAMYLKKKHYKVIQFDIYDVTNPDDANEKDWISRCEKEMQNVLNQNQSIVLIGFSMGGVIASYLASIFKIERLILVAPAFEYLSIQKVMNQGLKVVKNISSSSQSLPKPSNQQVQAFMNVISTYKDSIYEINAPTLILHGLEDEVIPYSSSKNASKKINCKHQLILFEGGKHRMLYDDTIQECIFPIILLMIQGQLTIN